MLQTNYDLPLVMKGKFGIIVHYYEFCSYETFTLLGVHNIVIIVINSFRK